MKELANVFTKLKPQNEKSHMDTMNFEEENVSHKYCCEIIIELVCVAYSNQFLQINLTAIFQIQIPTTTTTSSSNSSSEFLYEMLKFQHNYIHCIMRNTCIQLNGHGLHIENNQHFMPGQILFKHKEILGKYCALFYNNRELSNKSNGI